VGGVGGESGSVCYRVGERLAGAALRQCGCQQVRSDMDIDGQSPKIDGASTTKVRSNLGLEAYVPFATCTIMLAACLLLSSYRQQVGQQS